jgi:hypothetical protein
VQRGKPAAIRRQPFPRRAHGIPAPFQ